MRPGFAAMIKHVSISPAVMPMLHKVAWGSRGCDDLECEGTVTYVRILHNQPRTMAAQEPAAGTLMIPVSELGVGVSNDGEA